MTLIPSDKLNIVEIADLPNRPKENGVRSKQSAWLRPYVPRPFTEIPRREWLHAKHYIRKHVVMTVGPGGYGKTSLILCNTVEMATGSGLIGPPPMVGDLKVAYWNGEDPDEEIERRIAAICLHHKIDSALLKDRLFLGDKLTGGRRIAALDRKGEVKFDEQLLSEVHQIIGEYKIDCVIFDPLVAFHRVPEANNGAMEEVVKTAFEGIADKHNCCVELSQHTRKTGQAAHGELTVDDSRGGGAITNAARSVRILNRMTGTEAVLPKITADERRHYLRINRDKTNLAPPGKAMWVHIVSVDLPNGHDMHPGDSVQAVEQWNYPHVFDGITPDDMRWMRETATAGTYRADSRADEWVGKPLAERLHLSLQDKGDRKRIHAVLKRWFDEGVLATEIRQDEDRHDRKYVIPGNWNESVQSASLDECD